jgi:hypothetical protein
VKTRIRIPVFFSIILGAAFALGGCSKFIANSQMDPNLPVAKHGLVYVDSGLQHVYVDQDKVTGDNLLLFLPPGNHELWANYYKQGIFTDTNTDHAMLKCSVESGKSYYFYAKNINGILTLQFIDESGARDKNAAARAKEEKRAFAEVKLPAAVPLSIRNKALISKALTAGETPLEGTWAGESDNNKKGNFVFKGLTYAAEYHGGVGGLFSDLEYLNGNTSGTFEYSNNVLALRILKKYINLDPSSKGAMMWENQNPDRTIKLDCTMMGDSLRLDFNGKTVGIYKRSE